MVEEDFFGFEKHCVLKILEILGLKRPPKAAEEKIMEHRSKSPPEVAPKEHWELRGRRSTDIPPKAAKGQRSTSWAKEHSAAVGLHSRMCFF